MPYLIELLLFCLPFALFFVWRRISPSLDQADPKLMPLALLGLGLTLAAAAWYGLTTRREPGAVYVPAEVAADGSVRPGHWTTRP